MNNKKLSHIFTIGFALFAMFFGAGNLLLPPLIGVKVGTEFLIAIIAFGLSGILLPFTGILAVTQSGDSFNDLGNKVHNKVGVIVGTIIMICIGPLIAIPRTAATTFEVGLKPFFPDLGALLPCILFFVITFALSIKPSKIVDVIGNYLTPILLVLLVALIVLGILNPEAATQTTKLNFADSFTFAFIEGYQTLDVMASVIFAGIIIKAAKDKGYHQTKQKSQVVIYSGIIAVVSLLFVYGGLIYLGATSGISNPEIKRSELLITISHNILGKYGLIAIALAMGFACLTTAIALTTAFGVFFQKIFNNKISYVLLVTICCLVSLFLSVFGVDAIINFAYPPLAFVYPITITIVLYVLIFSGKIKQKEPYIGALIGSVLISTCSVLNILGVLPESILNILNKIPLFSYDLGWILPSLIGFVIGLLISKNKN